VGRNEEVIALASATLEPTGDLEESYYYKALALARLGRGEEARQALDQALRFNPNYAAAQHALKELGL
jgi:tetratricopeptide (TPR) repeat protein